MPVLNTGTESNGVSAHGTLVYMDGVEIPELKDVTPPSLRREIFEVTRQSDLDERSKVGIRQYGDLEIEINLLFTDPVHSDLIDSWTTAVVHQFIVVFADGAEWTFDGYVFSIAPDSPVDGAQIARVRIRPTGGIALRPLLLTETGEDLLLENGELLEI